jgi:hypothetical protein
VIGPRTPTRDEFDRLLDEPGPRRAGRIREGSLDDIAGLAEDFRGLGDPEMWQVERPEGVRVHAFASGDVVKVVFVINDSAKAATAIVVADDVAKSLRDPFTGENIELRSGRATVHVAALGVRMLLVD